MENSCAPFVAQEVRYLSTVVCAPLADRIIHSIEFDAHSAAEVFSNRSVFYGVSISTTLLLLVVAVCEIVVGVFWRRV